MNKFLKAMVLGLGLISVNAQAVVVWVPTAHINQADNIYTHTPKEDKWFALCDYAKSDILPEGFGCAAKDVKGEVVSVQDFAKGEKLNDSKLRVYKHKNIFNDHVSVIIEEIR
nr:MAG TPA: hypothetical protein [Caudoviricetes sp.]